LKGDEKPKAAFIIADKNRLIDAWARDPGITKVVIFI
jgi:hypothetical protein